MTLTRFRAAERAACAKLRYSAGTSENVCPVALGCAGSCGREEHAMGTTQYMSSSTLLLIIVSYVVIAVGVVSWYSVLLSMLAQLDR
jgi:hypothetical protein